MTIELSAPEARRLALHALGFTAKRPAKANLGHLRRVFDRLHAVQIDSVNVLARAHYMPAFSRLGPYRMQALDDLAYRHREVFEYWGRQASFVPSEMHRLFRWRMEAQDSIWEHYAKPDAQQRRFLDRVLQQVRDRGPLAASDLEDPGTKRGPWWGWSAGKSALEWHFAAGRLAVAERRNFERVYDLAERVLPADALAAPTPDPDDARKELIELGAIAMGVGTARDIADFFEVAVSWRQPVVDGKRAAAPFKRLVAELVEEGRLTETRVEAWKEKAYVHPSAKVPRSVDVRAIVSPFDPVMADRRGAVPRPKRLFGLDYKIEIYVPKPKRKYGYYALPFICGDRFVARVDLKADRKTSTLQVLGAWSEPNTPDPTDPLADEMRLLGEWLELDRITVARKGDLAKPLAGALC